MRALLFVLLLSGCIHKVGDRCSEGDAFCPDAGVSLVCREGGLTSVPCPGPMGCSVDRSRSVLCDQSAGATPGQMCFPEYEGKGQCAGPMLLQCTHGGWAQVACPPGTACAKDGAAYTCK